MASGILVRSNEAAFCGEAKVYIRKYTRKKAVATTLDPLPYPHLASLVPVSGDPTSRNWRHPPPPPPPVATSALNEAQKTPSRGGHVTIELGACSRRELKALKKRLVSELRQIRALRIHIDSSTRPVYPSTATTITAGRTSAVRPSNAGDDKEISEPPGKKKTKEREGGSGAKRVNPFGGEGPRRKKRAPAWVGGVMKKCGQMLGKLMKHKHGWVFSTPVDAAALRLYDYHQVIKKPMDLGTVKANLDKGLYKSPLDFAADVRLTFNNAMTYNPRGHHVYSVAGLLSKRFEEMFNGVCNSFQGSKKRGLSSNVAVAEPEKREMQLIRQGNVSGKQGPERISVVKGLNLTNQLPVVPAAEQQIVEGGVSRGRLPKLKKAKDSKKREMSLEEKAELGMSLQELSPEQMEGLMPIVRKRNGCFVQDGDEIELDIEAIDHETLWELHRFVGYNKRMISKINGQDRLAIMQNKNKSPASVVAEVVGHEGERGDAMEEDVDIGGETPMANFPPVEIERDIDAISACVHHKSSSASSSSSGTNSTHSNSDSGKSFGTD